MDENVRLRSYVSLVAVVVLFLYVSPFLVLTHGDSLRNEFLQSCYKDNYSFDYCWSQSKEKAALLSQASRAYRDHIRALSPMVIKDRGLGGDVERIAKYLLRTANETA